MAIDANRYIICAYALLFWSFHIEMDDKLHFYTGRVGIYCSILHFYAPLSIFNHLFVPFKKCLLLLRFEMSRLFHCELSFQEKYVYIRKTNFVCSMKFEKKKHLFKQNFCSSIAETATMVARFGACFEQAAVKNIWPSSSGQKLGSSQPWARSN